YRPLAVSRHTASMPSVRESSTLLRAKILPKIELARESSRDLRVRWAAWSDSVFSARSRPDVVHNRPRRLRRKQRPYRVLIVALSEIDRNLLDRCLNNKPRAWEDFVDRFMGLVVHVINHTAQCRSINLSAADREDLAAEVFLAIVDNDMAVLRHFFGRRSLATSLTVIARRVVVRKLVEGRSSVPLGDMVAQAEAEEDEPEQRMGDREEVGRLLGQLHGSEATVVRMYHLEGKTYQEISRSVGMPENSVGPMLSRARAKLRRRAGVDGGTTLQRTSGLPRPCQPRSYSRAVLARYSWPHRHILIPIGS